MTKVKGRWRLQSIFVVLYAKKYIQYAYQFSRVTPRRAFPNPAFTDLSDNTDHIKNFWQISDHLNISRIIFSH